MLPSLFFGGARLLELRSYNSTQTIPSDVAAGDLIISAQYGNGSYQSPSGWTTVSDDSTFSYRYKVGMKLADGSEGGSAVALLSGTPLAITMVFKGNFDTATVAYASGTSTSGDPSSRTMLASAMGSKCVAMAMYSTTGSAVTQRDFVVGGVADGHDAELNAGTQHYVRFKLHDPSTPTEDIVADTGDYGWNAFSTFIINLT